MQTGIIVQARTGSTRLPNKVLLPFYEGKGILELTITKLRNNSKLPIVIATSNNSSDEKIIQLAKKCNVEFFVGSEKNVLERFIDAAEHFNFSSIIRVCSDNPFLDMSDLNILSNENEAYDYSCFIVNGNPSILSHVGFWAEKVSLKALKKIQKLSKKNQHQEHVTSYVYQYPEKFNINKIETHQMFSKRNIRLTLDTLEDFIVLKKIYACLVETKGNNNFDKHDVMNYLNENPSYFDSMEVNIKSNEK